MTYFLLYLLLINIITFSVWGIDKRKASKEKRRVPEKHLLILAAAGGWIGAAIGVQYFRHKTVKTSFARRLWGIVVAWVILSCVLLYQLQ